MFHTRSLGGAHRRSSLPELVGAGFPEIGNQKNTVCPFKGGREGFRAVEIGFEDFAGESAMLAWMARQRAHHELALGLQSTQNCAPLLPRCANHGNDFLAVG